MLYQHKDDIVSKGLQVNEKVMLYNNLFDHEVVQQIQHVMNNRYLFESMEEVKEYLQMMMRLEMVTKRRKKKEFLIYWIF